MNVIKECRILLMTLFICILAAKQVFLQKIFIQNMKHFSVKSVMIHKEKNPSSLIKMVVH